MKKETEKNKKIVDGRYIANKIKQDLKSQIFIMDQKPTLGIIIVGDNPVSENFVRYKKKFAVDIGVDVLEYRAAETASQTELIALIKTVIDETDGVVVQLPLPGHINQQDILDILPADKDPDVLGQPAYDRFIDEKKVLPPVTAAIIEIIRHYKVDVTEKIISIVGQGDLVGKPTADYFEFVGTAVHRIDEYTENMSKLLLESDIIVSGVGSPNLITADMVQDRVVLLDAGTSNDSGVLVGDISKDCLDKSSLFSMTPGGIGPLTIAVLFRNLLHIKQTKDI